MAVWTLEVRLVNSNGETVKAWPKKLEQIAANELYTNLVEELKKHYPDVKP